MFSEHRLKVEEFNNLETKEENSKYVQPRERIQY